MFDIEIVLGLFFATLFGHVYAARQIHQDLAFPSTICVRFDKREQSAEMIPAPSVRIDRRIAAIGAAFGEWSAVRFPEALFSACPSHCISNPIAAT